MWLFGDNWKTLKYLNINENPKDVHNLSENTVGENYYWILLTGASSGNNAKYRTREASSVIQW
jgi:hypothetical protein